MLGGADLALRLTKVALLPYGWVARERRPGVTILVYHRVGGGTAAQLDLPTELFEWQLRYLKEHCAVVALDGVVDIARGRRALSDDSVAITFDDGFEEVYHHAFPLLRRYELPATVYLTTAAVEHHQPFGVLARGESRRGRPLTWAQAAEMVASGLITIGAHTHTHLDLSSLSEAEIEREIADSNQLITARLGLAPLHFAYPWGHTSEAARRVVGRVYQTAAVGGSRKNPYATIDLTSLLRVPIQRSDARWFFRLKLGSYLLGEEWMRAIGDARRRSQQRGAQGVAVSR